MLRLQVEEDDTYNIYQIVELEDLKDRVIDDLKVTIEMIQEIDSKLNTEKQSEMLYRIIQVNIAGLNQKVYTKTNDIRDFDMKEFDKYYERSYKSYIRYHTELA